MSEEKLTIHDLDALMAIARKRKQVFIESLGEKGTWVWIQEMTQPQYDSVSVGILNRDGKPDMAKMKGLTRRVVSYGLCNDEGVPLFNKDDDHRLKMLPGNACREISEAIMVLSGMDAFKTEAQAEADFEAEKNG